VTIMPVYSSETRRDERAIVFLPTRSRMSRDARFQSVNEKMYPRYYLVSRPYVCGVQISVEVKLCLGSCNI
jgi:hypothetical protein